MTFGTIEAHSPKIILHTKKYVTFRERLTY